MVNKKASKVMGKKLIVKWDEDVKEPARVESGTHKIYIE